MNGGESSSDLMLANEGAVAEVSEASKATCTYNYCQSSSPVVQ